MLTICTNANAALINRVVVNTLKKCGKDIEYRLFDPPSKFFNISSEEVVLFMGTPYFKAIQSKGYIAKNRSLSSQRGTVFKTNSGGKFMFSYSPALTEIDTKHLPEVIWDVKLAERLHRTGGLEPELGVYGYVEDFSDVIAYIKWYYSEHGKPCDVALDLETMGFYPYYADKQIVSVSLTVEAGYSDVVYTYNISKDKLERLIKTLKYVLLSDKVKLCGANLKFDLIWIKEKWGLDCTNFVFDTLLAGSLINENRSNSLNAHAKEYTAIGGYDDSFNTKYDKGKMELIPKEDLVVYAGGDTDATHRTASVLRDELRQNRSLLRHYLIILHPAARAFEVVERRGLYADRKKFQELKTELEKTLHQLEQQGLGMMPAKLREKYKSDLKLSKTGLLRDFLFTKQGLNLKPKVLTEKTKEPSTSNDHLMMFIDDPKVADFIAVLERWNAAKKTLSTYVEGFLKHLRPDGRFHPTYMLFAGSVYGGDDKQGGTNTGRTSAKDPAIQTLPKHTFWAKKLRECYVAPPGKKMFQIDFSQGELRITACLANEQNMLYAYRKGIDLHALTGAKLGGISLEEMMHLKEKGEAGDEEAKALFKTLRQRAKAANFGLIYGMGAAGYKEYARSSYGVILTMEEAELQREAFFQTYPALVEWHRTYINFARSNGYVVSPLGRVRHLPLISSKNSSVSSKAERQAINSPVQSALSDLCLWSMVEIEDKVAPHGVEVVGMTHDSVYGYVPEEQAFELVDRTANVMEALPIKEKFNWDHQIPFPVDKEIGYSKASLEEV